MAWENLTKKEKESVKADLIACIVTVGLAIVFVIAFTFLNYRG